MTQGIEGTPGRRGRELLKPTRNNHLVIADVDAPNEDIQTIHSEGGITEWARSSIVRVCLRVERWKGFSRDVWRVPEMHRNPETFVCDLISVLE